MPDQLLPPDPSKDGWYWVGSNYHATVPAQFHSEYRRWRMFGRMWTIAADEAWSEGYRLASPHPIPTPEQLDALHALPAGIDRRNSRIQAVLANYQKATVDEPYARAMGRMSGFKMCAAMLRAALGAKPAPNDPPGNGLDDIRAATMDQWGVPRANKETAP